MLRRLLVGPLEKAVSLAMGILVLDVLWGVLSRHILQSQSSWTEELARFLLIWVGLLGASLGFSRGAHLGIDYLLGKLHPTAGRLLQAVAHLVVLFFAVSVLVVGGWTLVQSTLELGQVTPALGLKKGLVYLAVPISGVFIVLFTLDNLWAALRQPATSPHIRSNEDP